MSHLIILHFNCEDISGRYKTAVVVKKIGDRYVAYYVDFDNVVTISPNRRGLDVWLPNMLRTLLSQESGIVPKVKYSHSELWIEEELA